MVDFVDVKDEENNPKFDNSINKSVIEEDNKGIKMRYLTRSVWVLTIIGCSLTIFFLSDQPFYSMFISISLICLSSMFNLISVYILRERSQFSIGSYIVISISYFIAFAEVVVFILETTCSIIEPQGQKSINLNIIWQSIYWTSIVFNFILIQFLWVYWTQGHPVMSKRIKATFIYYLNFFKIIIIIGIILIVLIVIFFKSSFVNLLKIGPLLFIQLFNLGYCWVYYLILLGYGIIYFPFYFFNYTQTSNSIESNLKRMQKAQEDYESHVNKFIKDRKFLVDLCNQLIKTPKLMEMTANYCRIILEHTSRYETLIVYSDIVEEKDDIECDFKLKLGNLEEIYTVDKLAEMFMKYQSYIYLYSKKEILLLRSYYQIRNACDIGDSKTILYLNKDKANFVPKGHVKDYSIPLKEYSSFMIFITKAFGMFLFVISAIFYIIQICIPFFSTFYKPIPAFFMNDPQLFYPISSLLFFYFIYLTICSFYTLMRSMRFEGYIIIPHHTDKYGMVNNASMLNTIIFGLVYNIVLFFDNDKYYTQISIAFTFLSRSTNSTIYYGVIWAYPVLVTLFLIPFLFKMKKWNCNWFFGINEEKDADEKLLKDQKEKEKSNEEQKEKLTFSFDTVNRFQVFLEKFEKSYYKELNKE